MLNKSITSGTLFYPKCGHRWSRTSIHPPWTVGALSNWAMRPKHDSIEFLPIIQSFSNDLNAFKPFIDHHWIYFWYFLFFPTNPLSYNRVKKCCSWYRPAFIWLGTGTEWYSLKHYYKPVYDGFEPSRALTRHFSLGLYFTYTLRPLKESNLRVSLSRETPCYTVSTFTFSNYGTFIRELYGIVSDIAFYLYAIRA